MTVEITLISAAQGRDEIGAPKAATNAETTVFAQEMSVFANEHNTAAQKGFSAEAALSVYSFEYSGQTKARYNGTVLTIYRHFKNLKTGRTELHLGQRVADYGKQ